MGLQKPPWVGCWYATSSTFRVLCAPCGNVVKRLAKAADAEFMQRTPCVQRWLPWWQWSEVQNGLEAKVASSCSSRTCVSLAARVRLGWFVLAVPNAIHHQINQFKFLLRWIGLPWPAHNLFLSRNFDQLCPIVNLLPKRTTANSWELSGWVDTLMSGFANIVQLSFALVEAFRFCAAAEHWSFSDSAGVRLLKMLKPLPAFAGHGT